MPLTLALVIPVMLYLKSSKRSALPDPPGPKKLPLLGNTLQIPTSFEWLAYARWAKEYMSDIIHLTAVENDIIVLNSYKAATDLLEKRSSMYSSRRQFTMLSELMGWNTFMFTMPYGEPWRESRRAFVEYFQSSDGTRFHASHMECICKILPRLLDTPEDFLDITRQYVRPRLLTRTVQAHSNRGIKFQRNRRTVLIISIRHSTNNPFLTLAGHATVTLATPIGFRA
ncbi:hypothetical protein GALMADRAFT_145648 [Galerina marginata CBS 339.88]|uniref:Cytochrome P450 n=1 Tax=Galerina marginata (strain CBS 339.88) TaxID=685588 RepID=A0A067SGV1_GALM3|nr:hypothetical protein GALMADRAFT_145648 [Galerina marginata CBS 339.88]